MASCFPCLRNLHDACKGGNCSCTHAFGTVTETTDEPEENSSTEATQRVRRNKPDAAVKDQQSTGRKRAAKLYPLDSEKPCEWRSASSENPKGGGATPVTFGCDGFQQARHHGPDKNTLNNEEGNVHRICHVHHNTWHAKNDPDYDILKGIQGD